MISIAIDTAKFTKLQEKFSKYGPYALKSGLNAASSFLNEDNFKNSMYPANKNGGPFHWSSDKQRRYVYANVDLPYVRTGNLAKSGKFTVNEQSYWIEYSNTFPGWIWVIHPSHQIIGHKERGWPTINKFVVDSASHGNKKLMQEFKKAAINAWTEMDTFIFGGGAGL